MKNNETNHPNVKLSTEYYQQALELLKSKNTNKAMEIFEKSEYYSTSDEVRRYGIGVTHEKFSNWALALDAYKKRLSEMPNNYHLSYKVGRLLKKLNMPNEAIPYLENALVGDKVLSAWFYNLARCYEDIGDYRLAALNYENTINRQQMHRPENYRRLAFSLKKIGRETEALERYSEADLYRIPSNMSEKMYERYIAEASVKYAMAYEYYNELDNKMIFYESLSGSKIMGNPAGIFDYVFTNKKFSDFNHIWVINSFDAIPEEYRDKSNIIFVKRNSDAYLKYISTAKYLICDSVFAQYVVRKTGQKYLQTTHGIYYKTVGRESANKEVGVAISTRNYLQATHIIAPNDFMVKKQQTAYSIKGICSAQVAKVGYPRIDITLNASASLKNSIMDRLNINNMKSNVLYAPTWRGSSKNNQFDVERLLHDLEALAKIDANIIFRGHPITSSILENVSMPVNIIIPPDDISTNILMSFTDVLISDYSSVFFDFIPTTRPIVHYLYDLDEYLSERGLNLSEDDLPGFIAKTTSELVNCVNSGIKNQIPSKHYLETKERFCPYDKGNSGKDVAKWFFNADCSNIDLIENEKFNKSDLFLGGLLSDKNILPSMVTDVKKRQNKNHIVTAMMQGGVLKDEDKKAKIIALGSEVNFVPYGTTMAKTLEEIVAIKDFEKNGFFSTKKAEQAYQTAYQREWKRLFGDSIFDDVINLESSSLFWSSLYKNKPESSITSIRKKFKFS